MISRNNVPLILAPLLVIAALLAFMIPRQGGAESTPALQGTVLPPRPAPEFALRDQFGAQISPATLRGGPIILTFLSATCTQLCPVMAETIGRTLTELGSAGKKVGVIAVTTAPESDTPRLVAQFSKEHHLLRRWHFINAGRYRLTPVWHAYAVYAAPASAPKSIRDAHTAATYLLDSAGKERVLLGGVPDPAILRRDLAILLGVPAQAGGNLAVPAPEVGHRAPDIRLGTLAGARTQLRLLRGQIVLVNFWATWCRPCRSEAPLLDRWFRRLHGKGFTVLGVDQQEGASDISAFSRTFKLTYPIVLDRSGSVDARYNVRGLPTSLLIDRQGMVVLVQLGPVDDAFFEKTVLPLIRH